VSRPSARPIMIRSRLSSSPLIRNTVITRHAERRDDNTPPLCHFYRGRE
jgi:hypothetical protein